MISQFFFLILQNHHYFVISQKDFLISQNRFGVLVLRINDGPRNMHMHVRFHSYRREKLIVWAFAARINGTQITIWATTRVLGTVAKAQAVQM